jgi:DNA-binding transcriptional regulator/RsmH inhibitor MraZ
MVFGEYHYKVRQGKIIIPPSVRQFFTTGVKFLLLEEGCVAGIPSVDGMPVDRRGRVTLPSNLRKAARIEDEVIVLMDCDDYFEVWGKGSWELEIARAQDQADQLTQSMYKSALKPD